MTLGSSDSTPGSFPPWSALDNACFCACGRLRHSGAKGKGGLVHTQFILSKGTWNKENTVTVFSGREKTLSLLLHWQQEPSQLHFEKFRVETDPWVSTSCSRGLRLTAGLCSPQAHPHRVQLHEWWHCHLFSAGLSFPSSPPCDSCAFFIP